MTTRLQRDQRHRARAGSDAASDSVARELAASDTLGPMLLPPQVASPPSKTPASGARLGLAGTVDYLLFAAAFSVLAWPFSSAGGSVAVRVLAFAVVETLTLRVAGASPGTLVLGIRRVEAGWGVDAPALGLETWWTLLTGVALVYEGSSNLVRFTDGLPPPPVFGLELAAPLAAAVVSLVGAANLAAGILVLRGSRIGPALGAAVLVLEGCSVAAAPEAVRAWIARLVPARRALQGLAVRDGEVAFMQSFLPTAAMVGAVFGTGLLLLVHRRFARR